MPIAHSSILLPYPLPSYPHAIYHRIYPGPRLSIDGAALPSLRTYLTTYNEVEQSVNRTTQTLQDEGNFPP